MTDCGKQPAWFKELVWFMIFVGQFSFLTGGIARQFITKCLKRNCLVWFLYEED